MISSLFKRVFGSRNDRLIRQLRKVANKVNELESEFEQLSDDALRAKTLEFKQRLEKDTKLENLIPEAFATVREASKRVLEMRHFDVQLIGGMILNDHKIAEVRTQR